MSKNKWTDKLQELMRLRGFNMKSLSVAAGLNETYVRDVIKRGYSPSAENLERLAKALNVTLTELASPATYVATTEYLTQPIPIVGKVAAGVWLEIDERADTADTFSDRECSDFPPDPRYPPSTQYDLKIEGSSINRVAPSGYFLRCVSIPDTGLEIRDKDLVIVRRMRDDGAMIEMTAKRVRFAGNQIELWPDSDDPRWQSPLKVADQKSVDNGVTVDIIARVLYAYKKP